MKEISKSFDFDYTITRSKRKTVSIIVERSGAVRVLAPLKFPEKSIVAFILEKQAWIIKKRRELQAHQLQRPTFKEDSHIEFMGRTLKVAHHIVQKKSDEFICLVDDVIHYNRRDFSYDAMLDDTERWYRQQALMLFHERVAYFNTILDRKPTKISIKTQRKRWGSCTSKGHILLNWRLILAPLEVIDYVILHELCHLYHMNHSKQFWDLVSKIDPHFGEKRLWLKQYGAIISWPYEI
ncbi:MAG TPA: SprT family zinc-dependent metalloprotease [Fusibacter sp.]|nr:SprT family zinc-dependent metalloprotease [Fusibacter sp.]